MLPIRFAAHAGFAAAAALLPSQPTHAAQRADYPLRPIRLLVPSAPGASNDSVARLVANGLTLVFDKPVVVDNRPGAGGIIASELVAHAQPDGHTILFVYATFTTAPFLQPKLPYDPVKDFAPITEIANQPLMLVVNTSVPASSVKELIALCKAKPGTLTSGYTQIGSATHLATEIFKHRTDIAKSLVSVSYKGGAAVQVALLSGEIQVAFATATATIPQLKSGKLKVLATSAPARLPYLPEVQTFSEAGVNGIDVSVWQGLLAPAATPHAIVEHLYAETAKLLKENDTRQKLTLLGSDPVASTPEQFKAKIRRELQEFGKIIKTLGLRP
ncbi:MAG TPA: tripartite tricarboxylate transporter substrate binding protein [Burkholderiales bacterium]|nr:tripartite tricarboxylate transporter substrate binding protein [Burkholderiales bacterium]